MIPVIQPDQEIAQPGPTGYLTNDPYLTPEPLEPELEAGP